MNNDPTTGTIIESALKVHSGLGPGLLESAYEVCLIHELEKRRISCRRQVAMPIRYDDTDLETGYRLDLLVDEKVVVEVKSCQSFLPIHTAQLLTYLRLGNFRVGLLLNFNVVHMRDGIRRLINT